MKLITYLNSILVFTILISFNILSEGNTSVMECDKQAHTLAESVNVVTGSTMSSEQINTLYQGLFDACLDQVGPQLEQK